MLEIGAVVWGVQDVSRAVEFWSQTLNYMLKYPASDDWAFLISIDGNEIQLSISKAASPKAKRHQPSGFIY